MSQNISWACECKDLLHGNLLLLINLCNILTNFRWVFVEHVYHKIKLFLAGQNYAPDLKVQQVPIEHVFRIFKISLDFCTYPYNTVKNDPTVLARATLSKELSQLQVRIHLPFYEAKLIGRFSYFSNFLSWVLKYAYPFLRSLLAWLKLLIMDRLLSF